MAKQNRIYGLMVGATIGLAFWGCMGIGRGRAERDEAVFAASPAIVEPAPGQGGGDVGAGGEKEEAPLELHALSAVLMDGDTGRILYEKQGDTFRPMASTTKIMTCILALENGNLSDICTVSPKAAAQPKVHLGAAKGTQFYLKDLLYSLMLESHNDSAVIIAEHLGGSVEGFAAMMNQKAKELGCGGTCFVTPNGLDATYTAPDGKEYTHGTTAKELAAIMRYCVAQSPKREEFLAITQASSHEFTDIGGKHSYSCMNHNAFLSMMDGVLSGKTGFTNGAGYSYVAAMEDEGRTFVLALLGSGWPPHKTYKWSDAKSLFCYGKSHYHYKDVYREPRLEPVPVRDGALRQERGGKRRGHLGAPVRGDLTTGPPESGQHLELLLAEDEQVECRVEAPGSLDAPVKEGQDVGRMDYLLDGEIIQSYPLYAGQDVGRMDFPYCFWQVWYRYALWP